MIKLNRTTEYGLVALRHMQQKPHAPASAREIADRYGFPFEILAKTLQRLKDTGIIRSAQGARGGYRINQELNKVNLAQFIKLMEGSQGVVACIDSERDSMSSPACCYQHDCNLKDPMRSLNQKIYNFLSTIYLDEFTQAPNTSLFSTVSTLENPISFQQAQEP